MIRGDKSLFKARPGDYVLDVEGEDALSLPVCLPLSVCLSICLSVSLSPSLSSLLCFFLICLNSLSAHGLLGLDYDKGRCRSDFKQEDATFSYVQRKV